jgi:hypothetical protein
MSEIPTLRWLVVAGWVIAGVRVTRVAVRLGLGPSVRVGIGLTLLAVAYCYRLATELAQSNGLPGLTFSALRLVALLFVGIGAVQFGKRALQSLREENRPHQPEPAQMRLPGDEGVGPISDEAEFSTFANEQALRAARVFDEATHAARRVAGFVSRPPRAGRLAGLPRLGSALVLLGATLAISRIPAVNEWLSLREVGVSLALLAVAGGVLSAFACGVLGQLGDEPAGWWLAAGLPFYSVIGVPVATFIANSTYSDAAVGNLRIVANATFVVLTLAAVFTAARPRRDGWVVLPSA